MALVASVGGVEALAPLRVVVVVAVGFQVEVVAASAAAIDSLVVAIATATVLQVAPPLALEDLTGGTEVIEASLVVGLIPAAADAHLTTDKVVLEAETVAVVTVVATPVDRPGATWSPLVQGMPVEMTEEMIEETVTEMAHEMIRVATVSTTETMTDLLATTTDPGTMTTESEDMTAAVTTLILANYVATSCAFSTDKFLFMDPHLGARTSSVVAFPSLIFPLGI